MTIAAEDIGLLVAETAQNYLGIPSTHHSHFHTGRYYVESRKHRQVHLAHSIGTGLDCSGFVNLVLADVFGRLGIETKIPRHVKEFYRWERTTPVAPDPSEFVPGILLFIHANGKRTPPDHVGIYLGKDHVAHSPGKDGSEIQIVGLDSFTRHTELPPFYGAVMAARRLLI